MDSLSRGRGEFLSLTTRSFSERGTHMRIALKVTAITILAAGAAYCLFKAAQAMVTGIQSFREKISELEMLTQDADDNGYWPM